MRVSLALILTAGSGICALAQSTAGPAFEAADIHTSPRNPVPRMTGGTVSGVRYAIRNASLLDLIRTAYGITDRTMVGADDNTRIARGPSWLDVDRFDVIAKVPPSTTRETAALMLRTLLAERFHLVVHTDTMALPGFALKIGKGKPRMKASDGTVSSGCKAPQPPDPDYFEYSCRNITMEAFADWLRGASYSLNSPVVDNTGLKGAWDFNLKWRGPNNVSIFEAVDGQMGLKLEAQAVPRLAIVVDTVNRTPSTNPPGLEARLPPPLPDRFEVAEIKLSALGAPTRRRIQPGGRLDMQSFTLRALIGLAWNLDNDDMVADAPKFLDTVRFDIQASASGGASSPPVDLEDLRPMLRNLLIERFNLTVHTENRPWSAYKLVAAKPKMEKADPSTRTGCKEGPGADGKDPRVAAPWLARLVSCQNVTMAQFAEELQYFGGGYLDHRVADATKLDGQFDFSLNFSPPGLIQAAKQSASQNTPAGSASDPSSLLSLEDALSKQLGLKLEADKRPLPVLVIDHVEEQPTGN